ncbi:BF3164 family lipoprotein [Chryseobacterium sp. CFS15]|uniref:BF3164 family lipoprotein n=1 Tax=Chryseobacterium sp. CFS15 TaxID=2986946 RepID=UPI0028076618|nr:BF3164 family lipoprotein [Chryseobacterium sp. CFS15]MDQ8140571.1 BF3164 family lipoprotein [Chryseobacterium sp. CFS15]
MKHTYISYNFILFLFFLIFYSCKQNNNNVEFKIQKNDSDINLNGSDKLSIVLKPINIHGIFTSIAVVDSILICGNFRSEKLINIYSLNNNKLIDTIITRGNAQNEGLSVANIFIQNNQIAWIYDITLSKLFKINIDYLQKNKVIEKEIRLPTNLKNLISPSIIGDSLLLATTYSMDNCRYFYADFQQIKKKIGKLPKVNNNKLLEDIPNTKFPNKAYLFKATSIKHSFKNKVAVFYNKASRAEFYVNDKLEKTIYNKDNFNPKMYVTKLKMGFSVEDDEKTIYAYLSVAYTEDYIYCLFSGDKNGETSSEKILIFDWDGNFIKELSLDRKVSKICINQKTKTLYCYDDRVKSIFLTKLNF